VTTASTDHLIGPRSSVTGVPPDQLVHALAQLPDRVKFQLPVEASQHLRLERLAAAYGIADRVTFVPSTITPQSRDETPSISTRANLLFGELVEGLYLDGDPPASCDRHDSVLEGHRVGLITNLPAQYRIPLFGRLAERLAIAGADFRVFFLRESTSGRSWIATEEGIGFDYEVLSSLEVPIRARRPSIPTSLDRRLAAFKPSILVSAGFSPLVTGRVGVFARRNGASFGVWSGEHAAMATAQSTLRRIQRRRLLAHADFGIAYGSASAQYLEGLNGELPVVYGRNTSIPSRNAARRASADRVEVIAVGDLASTRKGVDILVDALAMVPSLLCRLTVVGGGRMLSALKRRADGDQRIRFLGPLTPAAVREAYAAADVFVFPSRSDVFGLSLVEAMGSGLAVATSSAPGAVKDLCVDGHNAIVLSVHQPEEWAAALTRLVEDSVLRESLGKKANMTISRRWTVEHAADAMLAGLRLGASPIEGAGTS
jgi:glycosyltransferase involved in cell wall biosynthesis